MEKRRLQPEAPDMGASRLGSVNHLRLTVTDIERARQFYGPLMRFLGYEVVDDAQERLSWGKQFSTGVLWFILTAAREDVNHQPHDLLSPGLHHLAWNADSRDQIDEVHRMMCRNGATVLDTPAEYDYEPGYYAVFFADPDGMKIEVMYVPMQAVTNEKQANRRGAHALPLPRRSQKRIRDTESDPSM
jgi:glyoxylase I family protein